MILCGSANLVGVRSGQKNDKKWCSVVLDALDNPLERVEYFVPDELIGKVEKLPTGRVFVSVRVYPAKERSFGSRLVDIDVSKEGGNKV